MGEYGKAVAALSPSTPSAIDDTSFKALLEKHPKASPVVTGPAAPIPLIVSVEIVKKMVLSFPSGSGPGPMGLRAEHIRPCFKLNLQTNLLESLTQFVNELIAGRVNPSIAPHLAGASLYALEKKGGGIRPLACGNLLRRLASKCICFLTREHFKNHLAPHQVGVAVPGGVEIVIHEARFVRDLFNSDKKFDKHGFLKVDFRNAFNEVDRQAIYNELVANFPQLVPYFTWCYANPTTLFFGKYKVSSERGVQQGDPLGPFLFSLVLQKLILKLVDSHPSLTLNKWYLDDGNIAGPLCILPSVLDEIDRIGSSLGLFLNRSKCQVYGFKTSPNPKLFPKLEIGDSSNFDTLGAPVGSIEHSSGFISDKLKKVFDIFDTLVKLEDSQIAFTLLRSCCSFGKIVFHLRTTPPQLIKEVCQDFDQKVLMCLENLLSCALDPPARNQASLPLSRGGPGLRSAAQHAPACYIASLKNAMEFSSLKLSLDQACVDSLNQLVSSPFQTDLNLTQSQLSSKIDSVVLEKLLSSASSTSKARLKSILGSHATAWLSVIPSTRLGTKFNHTQFQTAMKLFLGLPVYSKDSICPCQKPLDKCGIHSLACKSKGDIISRHNSIRDVIFQNCKDAGMTVKKEKAGLLGDHGDKRRPADVWIQNFSLNMDYCLDVAVTSPLQKKYREQAAKTEGHAAADYYKYKIGHYAKAVEEANMKFQPIIFETFGRIAPESLKALTKIAIRKADQKSLSHSQSIQSFFQQLSVSLQVRNANMVLKRDSCRT
jgi:hypothetical protein